VGTGVFGALFGRKKLATAAGGVLRGAGRAQREHGDVARAEETVGAIQAQLRDLQAQFDSEMSMVQQRMDASSEPLDGVAVKPKKANVQVRLLTLAWVPYTPTPDGQLQAAWK
jgi:Sec-independent protein translocase protein TatA